MIDVAEKQRERVASMESIADQAKADKLQELTPAEAETPLSPEAQNAVELAGELAIRRQLLTELVLPDEILQHLDSLALSEISFKRVGGTYILNFSGNNAAKHIAMADMTQLIGSDKLLHQEIDEDTEKSSFAPNGAYYTEQNIILLNAEVPADVLAHEEEHALSQAFNDANRQAIQSRANSLKLRQQGHALHSHLITSEIDYMKLEPDQQDQYILDILADPTQLEQYTEIINTEKVKSRSKTIDGIVDNLNTEIQNREYVEEISTNLHTWNPEHPYTIEMAGISSNEYDADNPQHAGILMIIRFLNQQRTQAGFAENSLSLVNELLMSRSDASIEQVIDMLTQIKILSESGLTHITTPENNLNNEVQRAQLLTQFNEKYNTQLTPQQFSLIEQYVSEGNELNLSLDEAEQLPDDLPRLDTKAGGRQRKYDEDKTRSYLAYQTKNAFDYDGIAKVWRNPTSSGGDRFKALLRTLSHGGVRGSILGGRTFGIPGTGHHLDQTILGNFRNRGIFAENDWSKFWEHILPPAAVEAMKLNKSFPIVDQAIAYSARGLSEHNQAVYNGTFEALQKNAGLEKNQILLMAEAVGGFRVDVYRGDMQRNTATLNERDYQRNNTELYNALSNSPRHKHIDPIYLDRLNRENKRWNGNQDVNISQEVILKGTVTDVLMEQILELVEINLNPKKPDTDFRKENFNLQAEMENLGRAVMKKDNPENPNERFGIKELSELIEIIDNIGYDDPDAKSTITGRNDNYREFIEIDGKKFSVETARQFVALFTQARFLQQSAIGLYNTVYENKLVDISDPNATISRIQPTNLNAVKPGIYALGPQTNTLVPANNLNSPLIYYVKQTNNILRYDLDSPIEVDTGIQGISSVTVNHIDGFSEEQMHSTYGEFDYINERPGAKYIHKITNNNQVQQRRLDIRKGATYEYKDWKDETRDGDEIYTKFRLRLELAELTRKAADDRELLFGSLANMEKWARRGALALIVLNPALAPALATYIVLSSFTLGPWLEYQREYYGAVKGKSAELKQELDRMSDTFAEGAKGRLGGRQRGALNSILKEIESKVKKLNKAKPEGWSYTESNFITRLLWNLHKLFS
jgi:hypothetical protein